MKTAAEKGDGPKPGRRSVFLVVLNLLAVSLTISLVTICTLIWTGQGIEHAQLVDQETLIALTGYVLFLLFTHALGVIGSVWRSTLMLTILAMALLISFAIDLTTGSIATLRYQQLWADGPNNETMRDSWGKLSLPQRDALQVELNCCGFASPADDLFETVVCFPEAELPGCHLPWKNFLSYEAVGVATTFYGTGAMHALLLALAAGTIARWVRKASVCPDSLTTQRSMASRVGWLRNSREFPSRPPSVAGGRRLYGRVDRLADSGRCSDWTAGFARPVPGASATRASVSFGSRLTADLSAATHCCADSNPRHSRLITVNSMLSEDSFPSASSPSEGEQRCCRCAGGGNYRNSNYRSSVISDRCCRCAGGGNYRSSVISDRSSLVVDDDARQWEYSRPKGPRMSNSARIARTSRVYPSSASTADLTYPSNPVSAISIASYHTAKEDIERAPHIASYHSVKEGCERVPPFSSYHTAEADIESTVGELRPSHGLLEWDDDVERFLSGSPSGGSSQAHDGDADKMSSDSSDVLKLKLG